ncbi:aldo/keto reductase [Streptomyces mirabilis]|uniref:aldo/keto reductase n=1 Tax=Streptomyces mirabilis TaxID=68239 RepID=UPI0036753E22
MQYRTLGRTGVQVSSLALGTMNFGSFGSTTEAETTAMVRRALDAGVNLIDTADAYSGGVSEELVGRALKGVDRDEVVLATKFRLPLGDISRLGEMKGPAVMNRQGGSRRWIVKAVEDSLRRLDTDRIDLYQMHRPDPTTDIEESLSALTDLQRAGKILYIGTSTFSAAEMVEAQWVSERRRLARFATEQPPYSILVRGIEADVLPTARKYGMGVLTWSPLASGFLSGKYRPGGAVEQSYRDRLAAGRPMPPATADDARKREAAEQLHTLAEENGMSLVEMSLAFVTGHPAVTSALIGPRTMEQLDAQLACGDRVLSGELLDRIDEIVAPGRTIRPADAHAVNPALEPASRRR